MSEQHIILHIIVKSKLDNGFCYLGYDNESNRILRPLASVDSCTSKCKPFIETELYERKAYKFTYTSSAQENLPKPHGTEDLIVTSAEEVPMEIAWENLVEKLFSMASPKLRSTCQAYISTPRSGRITKYYVYRRTNCSSVGILLTNTLTFYQQFGKNRVKASVNIYPTVEAENVHSESPASEEHAAQDQVQNTSTSNSTKRQYSAAFSDDDDVKPEDEDLVIKKRIIDSNPTVAEENRCTNPLGNFFLLARKRKTESNESNTQSVVPTGTDKTQSYSAECVKLFDSITKEVINSDENVPSHFMTTAKELQEHDIPSKDSENDQLQNSSKSLLKSSEQGKPNVERDRRSDETNVEFITESPFLEDIEDWSTTYDFPYTAPQIPSSNNLTNEKVEKLLMLSMCRPGGGKQPDKCFLIGVGVIERSDKTKSS